MKSLSYLAILLSVVFLSDKDAFAQWISQTSNLPGTGRVYTLSVVDEDTVWAMGIAPFFDGSYQGYSITHNAGVTWTGGSVTGVLNFKNACLYAYNGSTAWMAMYKLVGAGSGGIFKTTDGGASWVQQSSAFPDPGSYPNFVYFFDADDGVCMGDPQNGYFEIYTTSDGGSNWVNVPGTNIPASVADEFGFASVYNVMDDSTLWFGSSGGRVFRTTDRGATWQAFDAGLGAVQVQTAFQDADNGLAVALLTTDMARTTDGGETWTPIAAPPRGGSLNYVPGTIATYLTCSASSSPLGSAYTLDGGENWVVVDGSDHGPPSFANSSVGWTGNFFNSTIYKWAGPVLPVNAPPAAVPLAFSLSQNYPNPFNPETDFGFRISDFGLVNINIYDIQGRLVKTVINKELVPGSYEANWSGNDDNGLPVASGVYFYRLTASDQRSANKVFQQTRKMVLMR